MHPAPRPAHLRRRYLRRRLTVGLVAVATPAVMAIGVAHAGASRDADPPVRYVVQPGDTMWSLAQRLPHEGSVSSYVDELVEANGGAALAVGQVIVLPG